MAMTLDSLAKLIADVQERRASEMREILSTLSTIARTAAGSVCHSEATTVALPTAFGGLTYTPDSSTSPSSSSGIPNADLAVAIDASNLTVFVPAKCSTEGPSRDACESRSPTVPATAPTPPSGTVDIISVLASTAESEEALDGDAVTGVVSMCSADGMQHGTREETPKAGALLFEAIPGWQSSSARALPRFVMKIPEEVIFELTLASNTSDKVSPYAESLHAPCERVWLLHVSHCPPDAPDCTRGLFSSLQPYLPAPVPKPPWLLLLHELVTGQGRPTLVFADLQGLLLLPGNMCQSFRWFENVKKIASNMESDITCLQLQQFCSIIEELEERENYASDNLTNEGKEVLKTGSRSWQLKPPWLSFRLVSCATVMSHLIWERSKKCDPNGLVQSIFVAPELHMPWFVANLSHTPTCDTFSELYSTTGTWYFNDEISSVMQWRSGIKEVQRVSVFLDTSFGSRSCVTRISMQMSDTYSILKLLSSCSTVGGSCYGPSWRLCSVVKLFILLHSTTRYLWVISPWDADEMMSESNKHCSLLELPEVTLFVPTCRENAEVQSTVKLLYTTVRVLLLEKGKSESTGSSSVDNRKLGGKEVLTISFCGGTLHELLWLEFDLFSSGTCEAHKVRRYRKCTYANQSQERTNFKMEHVSYPADKGSIPDAHRDVDDHARESFFEREFCVVAFGFSFTLIGDMLSMDICMNIENSRGSGELIWWSIGYLLGKCFLINIYDSELSSINRPSQTSIAGLRAWTALIFWAPLDLNDKASQRWRIPLDPGFYIIELCSLQKWWTTPEHPRVHCSEHLQGSSALFVGESRILLVAWDVDDLEFSTGCGHASFQEGRTDIGLQLPCRRETCPFSYDHYLEEAYYFDPNYSNLKYY